jgi:hypothetical protein
MTKSNNSLDHSVPEQENELSQNYPVVTPDELIASLNGESFTQFVTRILQNRSGQKSYPIHTILIDDEKEIFDSEEQLLIDLISLLGMEKVESWILDIDIFFSPTAVEEQLRIVKD